jgi:hypothetical protein
MNFARIQRAPTNHYHSRGRKPEMNGLSEPVHFLSRQYKDFN